MERGYMRILLEIFSIMLLVGLFRKNVTAASDFAETREKTDGFSYITDLTINDSDAVVTYYTTADSDLVVAVYEEDDHNYSLMRASGTAFII